MGIIELWHNGLKKLRKFFLRFHKKPVVISKEKESGIEIEIKETDQAFKKKILLAALANTRGIGYYSLRSIYPILKLNCKTLTSIEIINRLPKDLRNKGLIAQKLLSPDIELLEKTKERYHAHKLNGIQFYFEEEEIFPPNLRHIKRPPYWLFVQGNVSILHADNIVAIIGTRKPSSHSLKTTQMLVEFLISKGFIILSGLARGIDSVAHTVTIKGGGKTIAVLGHGVYVSLSKESLKLRDEIIDTGGAVITEYFPNVRYSRDTFILRNRIQTALSSTVIPIQCKIHSGTAHTINYAIEQKKKLFTIIHRSIRENKNDVYQIMELNDKPIFYLPRDYEVMTKYLMNREEKLGQKGSNTQLSLDL